LAGHGDDDYYKASKKQLKAALESGVTLGGRKLDDGELITIKKALRGRWLSVIEAINAVCSK
jgi:hypothetical protein